MHVNGKLKPAELATNQRRLEIISYFLAELKPDPANPHSKKQIRQIAKIISVFGFNVPVLVDAELNVIAGHGRLLASHELGIDKVPTLCVDHLTPAQARAFRIADNKLTENATWDERVLGEQLRDLSLSGLDFDFEVTGFEMGEIDLLIDALEDTPAAGSDPADILPGVLAAPLVSKLGDLWLLGRDRVLCGNALDPEAFAALMGAERAVMVFTLGSGTTVIAAERTGRRCRALELDPAYVDTAIRRWQVLTGEKAHKASDGCRFDDLADEAEAANAA
jgi:hypothetical protein